MSRTHLLLAVSLLLSLSASTARANTITVESLEMTTAADATCTLAEGMARAISGSGATECAPTGPAGVLEVVLPEGTADLTGTGAAFVLTGEIVIRGARADRTTLRNASTGRLVLFEIATGANVTIDSLGMRGFHGASGTAGIVFARANSTLTVRNCIFRDGVSDQYGGAIRMLNVGTTTALTVLNSRFENNSASEGAAIHAQDTVVVVRDSVFLDNSGASAPAISLWNSADDSLTVGTSTFQANHATGSSGSGVVLAQGPGRVRIDACSFNDNDAFVGGAVYLDSPATIIDSTFRNNEARSGQAGALYIGSGETVIDGCFFEDNRAAENGGAIWTGSSSFNVSRTRFLRNVAGHEGGAVVVRHDFLFDDCVFFDNVARLDGLTVTATTPRAIEGGDDGVVTLSRNLAGSAVRAYGRGQIANSCFLESSRVMVSSTAAVDARYNYWPTDDLTARSSGPVDTADALDDPTARCADLGEATEGFLDTNLEIAGTATSGTDFTAIEPRAIFEPGDSDLLVLVDALEDAAADPGETVVVRARSGDFSGEVTIAIDEPVLAPDVSIAKTVDRTTATVGDELVFTLTVRNDGRGVARNIVVTDAIPSGLMPLGATVDAPEGVVASCEPGVPATCTLSELAPDTSASVALRVRITSAGDITNRAEVTADGDPEPSNDASEVTVRVVPAGADAGSTPDAGVVSDGGTSDASGGAADAGGPSATTSGGCGCRAARADGGVFVTLVLLALVRSRRRAR